MKKWKHEWESGEKPEISQFADVYMRVKMRGWTAFLFWVFFLYRDIKRFDCIGYEGTTLYRGINLWVIKWGEYFLDKFNAAKSIILHYDLPDNAWFVRRIVDRIRVLADGSIIGKFCYRLFGREWFVCWFTLESR